MNACRGLLTGLTFAVLCAVADGDTGNAPYSPGTHPEAILLTLLADASNLPRLDVHNYIDSDVVARTARFTKKSGTLLSTDQVLALRYDFISLKEEPRSLVLRPNIAIYTCRLELPERSHPLPLRTALNVIANPAFDENGRWLYLDDDVRRQKRGYATFCLIREPTGWKVHCWYVSSDPLPEKEKEFIIRRLDLIVNKA